MLQQICYKAGCCLYSSALFFLHFPFSHNTIQWCFFFLFFFTIVFPNSAILSISVVLTCDLIAQVTIHCRFLLFWCYFWFHPSPKGSWHTREGLEEVKERKNYLQGCKRWSIWIFVCYFGRSHQTGFLLW